MRKMRKMRIRGEEKGISANCKRNVSWLKVLRSTKGTKTILYRRVTAPIPKTFGEFSGWESSLLVGGVAHNSDLCPGVDPTDLI